MFILAEQELTVFIIGDNDELYRINDPDITLNVTLRSDVHNIFHEIDAIGANLPVNLIEDDAIVHMVQTFISETAVSCRKTKQMLLNAKIVEQYPELHTAVNILIGQTLGLYQSGTIKGMLQ